MIVAIDIGNTAIKVALLKGREIVKEKLIYRLDSQATVRAKLIAALSSYKRFGPKLKDIVICSVVPRHCKLTEALIKKIYRRKAKVIGRDLKVPIKNNYKNPRHVGEDRLVGAYAAKCLYASPLVIIDFGTAVTIDVVGPRGAYEGGIIVPGIRLSAESLFKKTALLPNILTFKPPRSLIGRDTRSSILSGLFYGYGALCDGLIDRISHQMGRRPKVIITGGHTRAMRKLIARKIHRIDKQLVIKGIYLTYKAAR